MSTYPFWTWLVVLGALAQGIMLAGSIAVTLYVVRRLSGSVLKNRRIQQSTPRREVQRHELRQTAYSILTGALLTVFVVYLLRRGSITADTGPVSVFRIFAECAIYTLVLDAYQYVVHRLMHTRFLFGTVHTVHHRSRTPSALTAFSFHPVEMGTLAIYFPITLTVHTFHIYSIVILGFIQFFMNTIPHCGYEVFPAWWYKSRLTKWFLTPFFHDIHHQTSLYNFGAFTTLWDRLFGTIQPNFERNVAELHARSKTQSV